MRKRSKGSYSVECVPSISKTLDSEHQKENQKRGVLFVLIAVI